MKIKEAIKEVIRVEGWLMFIRRVLSIPLLLIAFSAMAVATLLWSIALAGCGKYRDARNCWSQIF